MPKETIFTPYPHDPATGPAPFQLQVGWQRDMDVQVGITTPADAGLAGSGQLHLVDYIYAQESAAIGKSFQVALSRIGREISDYPFDSNNPEHDVILEDELLGRMILDAVTGSTPFGTSVWWNPGRVQINRLIALLRKARDAAYGRDL